MYEKFEMKMNMKNDKIVDRLVICFTNFSLVCQLIVKYNNMLFVKYVKYVECKTLIFFSSAMIFANNDVTNESNLLKDSL